MFKTILELLYPIKEKDRRIEEAVKICKTQLRQRSEYLNKYRSKKEVNQSKNKIKVK